MENTKDKSKQKRKNQTHMRNGVVETNLEGLKDLAKAFLYLNIEKAKFSPVIIHHPFFDSAFVGLGKDNQLRVGNILENEEDLKLARLIKQEQIENAKSVVELSGLITKPYKFSFLKYAEGYLSPVDLGKYLAHNWSLVEYISTNKDISISELVRYLKMADKNSLMTEEEQEEIDSWPDQITIYRGLTDYNSKYIKGLSWTIDIRIAITLEQEEQNNEVVLQRDKELHIKAAEWAKEDLETIINIWENNPLRINIYGIFTDCVISGKIKYTGQSKDLKDFNNLIQVETGEGFKLRGKQNIYCCSMPSISAWKFDFMALKIFKELWDNKRDCIEETFSFIKRYYSPCADNDFDNNNDNLKKEIKRFENKLSVLIELYTDGDISIEKFRENKEKYKAKISSLKAQLDILEHRSSSIGDTEADGLLKVKEELNAIIDYSGEQIDKKVVVNYIDR